MIDPIVLPEHLRWLDDAARAAYETAHRFSAANAGSPDVAWGWDWAAGQARPWGTLAPSGLCFYAFLALQHVSPTEDQLAAVVAWAHAAKETLPPHLRENDMHRPFSALAEEVERLRLIGSECLQATPAGDFVNPEGEVVVKAGEEFPKTPKERDLRRCRALLTDAKERGERSGDNLEVVEAASREEQDLSLALHLHDGAQDARAEVNRRVATLAGYLMLWGGKNFLNDCRAAIAEERWGDLVLRIAGLEDQLVRDQSLRWELHETGDFRAEPTGEAHWHIPTNIDPGGPLL